MYRIFRVWLKWRFMPRPVLGIKHETDCRSKFTMIELALDLLMPTSVDSGFP